MNFLFFSHSDPYGIVNLASQAINKNTKHESRVVTLLETKNFDSDISLMRDMWGGFVTQPQGFWGGTFRNLIDWCDKLVIVFGMAGRDQAGNPIDDSFIKMDELEMIDIAKKSNKKILGLLSGSLLSRTKSQFFTKICKDNKWPLCTYQPELSISISEKYPCAYVPIILNINHPRYRNSLFDFVKKEEFSTDKIIISHSWMGRGETTEDKVLSVINELNKDDDIFIPMVINNCGFYDSLMMKKSSHIGIDMEVDDYLYSGIGSFENTLLGLINITSIDNKSLLLIEKTIENNLPWQIVHNNEDLKNILLGIKKEKNDLYDHMLHARNFALENFVPSKLVKKWIQFLGA